MPDTQNLSLTANYQKVGSGGKAITISGDTRGAEFVLASEEPDATMLGHPVPFRTSDTWGMEEGQALYARCRNFVVNLIYTEQP